MDAEGGADGTMDAGSDVFATCTPAMKPGVGVGPCSPSAVVTDVSMVSGCLSVFMSGRLKTQAKAMAAAQTPATVQRRHVRSMRFRSGFGHLFSDSASTCSRISLLSESGIRIRFMISAYFFMARCIP